MLPTDWKLHPFQNHSGADGAGVKELRSHLKLLSELHLVTSSCRTLRRCRQLSAGQTLSGAAAKTPPEEQSLQAGEPSLTMLGLLHFMLSYSPLSPSFHSLASQRASKGRVTLPHPLFAKARGVSTSAWFHCVFPPPNSQSEPSGPERHRSLSAHAASTAS